MAWWAWLAVAAVLVVVVLTRRWNPISRASAASELGRRYPVLIHFWRVWTVLAAAGIAGVAILLAIHPGTHVATAPAKVAKPSPSASPRAPAASPTPVATPTPVAASPSQGHIPGPVFIAVLIGLGMAAALTVWLARRHREDPDYWLDDYDDVNGEFDADGWPTGSDPDPHNDNDTTIPTTRRTSTMDTSTTTGTPPAQMKDRWWENALQSCSILAAVGGSATLEYRAGEHAGWPLWQAMLVPFALDAYVVRTLTNRLARRGDQAFALALLVAAVALSVFTPPPVWQAFGLGLVIIATLWRMDAQWRRKRVAADMVAEMGERLRLAREDTATARRELTAAREATADMINDAVADERRRLAREVADLRRQLLAANGDVGSDRPSDGPRPVADVDPPPVAADKDTQIAWVRRLLESDADATWRDVAEHLQLEPRAAQYRVTAARRPAALHSVTAVEATS